MRVEILCRDVVIGHAELDRLDPPMGVAEGSFVPSRHYDPRLHAYMIDCEENDLTGQEPLAAHSQTWGVIECLGTHVEDFNASLKEMNVSIVGIPSAQYSDMFASHPHYKAYYPN